MTSVIFLLAGARLVSAYDERFICTNTCNILFNGQPVVFDGECDDGSRAASFDICPCGSDCADCGEQPCACPLLELVETHECPEATNYPPCSQFGLTPGMLCEGDGECGTSQLADNCVSGNGFYDIYRVLGDDSSSTNKKTTRAPVWTIIVIVILVVILIVLMIALACFAKYHITHNQSIQGHVQPVVVSAVEVNAPPPPSKVPADSIEDGVEMSNVVRL